MKQIKKLTVGYASKYILQNYGIIKHNIYNLVKASRQTAKKYNCTPLDMFFFMIENRPIKKLYTHSYNFHTRKGRKIREVFADNYYSSL
tara:strand:+ start:447 stop:713 length:267 start_codon:yes stop_codon:yes gene_type:complete